jgi:hypothetical protein
VRCTDDEGYGPRRLALARLAGLTLLLAGCVTTAPRPAPAPPPAAPAPRPAPPPPPPAPDPAPPAPAAAAGRRPSVDLGPMVIQAPALAARNWDEFKRSAARRMVLASPNYAYLGKPPPMLFGIPILEVELNADGSVRNISVTRPPANEDAQDTIEIAKEAIHRAAPYGDMSKLTKPWKWTEVFLFNDKRQFKPRILD